MKKWCSLAFSAVSLVFTSIGASETLQNIKLDPVGSRGSGGAILTSTALDIGNVDAVFDGNVSSLARTPNISPAFVQVAYSTARTVRRFRVHCIGGDSYDWWVEKANTHADLDGHTGSYGIIVPVRNFPQATWDEYVLPAAASARLFRLNVKRNGGDNYCHINEWELYGDVVVDTIEVAPSSMNLAVGNSRSFRASGRNNGTNESYDLTNAVAWSTTGNVGTITSTGIFGATNSGPGAVLAQLGALISPSASVNVEAANNEPDIDVLLIERTPRLEFDPDDLTYGSGLPAPGQAVTYRAHLKNWGSNSVNVPFEWRFDGVSAGTGSVTINAGQEVTVPFAWNWQSADHTLQFIADPGNTLAELSKLNNRVEIRTNALLVGLWVEQSLYDHFHQHQYKLHDGANGFEDWGQRMVARWNQIAEKAIFPVSPNGVLDRVALDQVIVVPDGALPLAGGLATNNPDIRDRTVDMQWGYPWNPKDVEPGDFYGFRWNGAFHIDFGSIHEMNHARFHTDLYAIDQNQPPVPGQHILLTDDTGNLVAGTGLMPLLSFDNVYFNKWRDIMGGGPDNYDAYSAGVWNWKHHQRGRGNMNSPPDLEVFTTDLPQRNHVQFIDQKGVPIVGAQVSVYQSINEIIDNTSDYSYNTDSTGSILLPNNPFGAAPSAYSNAVIVFKLRVRGQLYFLFQEFTDFNLEYWRGNTADAYYVRGLDLRDNPATVPTSQWLGNYFNGPIHKTLTTSRTESTLDFTWPAAPAPGVNADDFSVYWQGDMQFTEGWKQFTLTCDGGLQLFIDGRLVFDQWTNTTLQTWRPILYTMADSPFVVPGHSTGNGGFHRVEVRYRHGTGAARMALSWADEPVPVAIPHNLWRADLYHNSDLSGYALSRLEMAIDYQYGSHSPDHTIGGDSWSARWIGMWDFPGGDFLFTAQKDEGMRVWIDDVLVLDQWSPTALTTYTFSRSMGAGTHKIEVHYFEAGGEATARFGWAPIQSADAEIVVEQPEGIALSDGNRSVDFGSTVPGATSGAKTFTIRNIGAKNLTLSGVTKSGGEPDDFPVNTDGMSNQLARGESTTFVVAFSPGSVGARSTTLAIASNDADESSFEISLAGEGRGLIEANDDLAFVGGSTKASVAIAALANDTGPAGDPLTIATVTQATFGSVQIRENKILYTALAKLAGTDSFTYTVRDTNGNSDTATVAVYSFNAIKGGYDGVASQSDRGAGMLVLSLSGTGSFTGKFTVAGASYALKGAFGPDGLFKKVIKMGSISLDLDLSIRPAGQSIEGTVKVTAVGGASSTYSVGSMLRGKFSTKAPAPTAIVGRYTAIIPSISGADPLLPHGHGYGLMTVSKTGRIAVVGKLGDGVPITVGASLRSDGATWTFFKSLYAAKHRGSITGLMRFANEVESDCSGDLDWIKPAQTAGGYYRDGFGPLTVNLCAAKYAVYLPPGLPSASSMRLAMGGGNLPADSIVAMLLVSGAQRIKVVGDNRNGVSVTLSPTSGAFSGSFSYPLTGKRATFGGAIYQKAGPGGYGLFTGPSQTGAATITP